jgi:hypothetical protein
VVDVPQIKKHDLYDNAGPSITGLSKDEVAPQQELAAFDQLGPLTRKVINEVMCVPWSSHKTLEMIWKEWCADPLSPSVDRDMAEVLIRANAKISAKIRLGNRPVRREAAE